MEHDAVAPRVAHVTRKCVQSHGDAPRLSIQRRCVSTHGVKRHVSDHTAFGLPKPTMTELEPITPREALELYCEDIDGELSPNSVRAKRYQLSKFVEWCEGADTDEPRVENLNNITGRDVTRFKNWRSEGINKVTLRTNLSALRTFMRFCVSVDAVSHAMPEKVNVPKLDSGANHNDEHIDASEAEAILEYLNRFEYASLDHVLFKLQWTTAMRMGGLHSLDVGDFDAENGTLSVTNRPEKGTRLKNGDDGERVVTLDAETAAIVADYIEYQRVGVTDDHGRDPLFSSKYGRMNKQNLNKRIYRVTTPCYTSRGCPADKDPLDCEHSGSYDNYVTCPYNTRPHAIRGGSITYWLRNDVPKKAVGDRVNASMKTLDRHYDERSEEEKAEQRRDFFAQ
ncbi:integrase [Halorubrum salipaludis]|uniref:Integrase n=1 Tax=Halorubrum salipaludis TaxID=2032630 RepID=A0A2A2FDF6_9EURY|nr:integrase [Halorubrum salipaludis]